MISRLGRFEIQAEIGRGGFGQVFRAFDPDMNRVVAVKVLTATEDAGSFTRFKNEATAAGNLQHDNIVIVHDVGKEGKTPFIVMEYLDGQDLKHVIENGPPLSLYQKIRVMDQVADGLYCAHRNGVVHRDVKPANIMVRKDGTVKVMDFGIARLTRDTSTRLTQQGYLIGTVVYMAPELFTGAEFEVDAMCDIWSFGVILYELLAGKNPFQTGNAQSEMYRIVNQEPPPLPPEICPMDLQEVIGKLLSRQREFRYQTLEDTRFDLQPILKSLEKSEVARLLSEAQQLMSRQRWGEALDKAREARRLDPQNRTAKIIFDRAQKELQLESLLPDLLRRSNEAAEQRNLTEAIDILKSALRLDTANERVLARLQDLGRIKQRLDEAAKLIGSAGREFRDKRLTVAFEHISEAIALDPDNPEAQRLREKIQSEIQVREADRALEAGIQRIRGLMTIDLDGAMKALQGLERQYPGRPDTKPLREKLERLIADRDRQRDFSRRLEDAKDLVRNAHFEDAVTELEQLLKSFPNEVAVTDLLSYAREEVTAKKKSEDVKEITNAAAELNRAQRFPEAIRKLEDGLRKYPDELSLTRLLRSIKRERELQSGMQRCDELRQGGQWQEALDQVARLISEDPNNRELADLETKIRQEKSQAESAAARRSAMLEAERLLRANRPDAAVNVLESAKLAAGGDRELEALLTRATEAQRAERERQYIESDLMHAREFEQRGDFTTSLRIIEEALVRSPKSRELLEVRTRLLGIDRERVHREREVSNVAAAIEQALERKEWPRAELELEEKTKLFPSEPVLSRLKEELQRRKGEEINQLVREGRRLLDGGLVAEAEQFCLDNFRDHRESSEVRSLVEAIQVEKRRRKKAEAEETQRKAFVVECLRAARRVKQSGDLDGSLGALQKGLDQYPLDPDLTAEQNRVNQEIASARQSQLLGAIGQALDLSNWPQAMQLLEQARQEYPSDPELIPYQARALDQRRAFLEGAAEAIRSKLRENKLDEAVTLFEQNLARHRDQSMVRGVADEIAAAQAVSAGEEQKRVFIAENLKQAALCEQQGDFARASAVLQKALKKYPADPELLAVLTRAQGAADRAERERALAAKTVVIKRSLDRGNWEEALKLLSDARLAFPENPPDLAGLEQHARNLRDREIQVLVDKGTGALKLGNLAEVEKLLNKNLAPYAAEPPVVNLANALKEEKLCASLIQGARSHMAGRRFDAAESALNELAARRPKDSEVGGLRAALEAAREQDRKEKLYRTGRAEGDQLLRDRKYPEAIARFEYLLTQFPGDAQLQRDLAGAVAGGQARTPVPVVQDSPGRDSGTRPKWWVYALGGAALAGLAGLAISMLHKPVKAFDVSPDQLNFHYLPGSPLEPQKITVTGSSDLPQSNADWVEVALGRASAGKTEFVVHVLPEKLAPGEHDADLVFPSQKKVRVEVVIPQPSSRPSQQFDIQPASLTFRYSPGVISAQKIVATGSSEIPNPSASEKWVTFTRKNLGAGKAEFSVRVSPNGLLAGKNAAYLIFPGERKVRVDLDVPGAEAPLDVTPLSLAFPAGGTEQKIMATGPPAIPEPKFKESWVTVKPRSLGPGKVEFLVQTSTAGLEPGKHEANLVFSPQKTVRVELTIPDNKVQTLTLDKAELQFKFKRTGPPASQTVTATGPASVAAPTKTADWLVVNVGNASANKTEFTVQVLADKLAPGPYSDDLIFPQKKVHVDLEVYDAPPRFCYKDGASTWSGGTLNPNDDLKIKGSQVPKGRVDPPLPTCPIKVDKAKLPPGLTVIANPAQDNNFTLHLRNESGGPLNSIAIPWTQ